jgi:hypothetical protein
MVAFVVITAMMPGRGIWQGGDPSPIKGVRWKCDAAFDGGDREIILVLGDGNIDYLRRESDQIYFVGRYTLDGSVLRATFDSDYSLHHNHADKLSRSLFWSGTLKESTAGILDIDIGETQSDDTNVIQVVAKCHKW